MVPLFDLAVLGAVAGFTIFFGLPVARMRNVSSQTKGMLNAAAAGILLFLFVDVMGNAFETVTGKALDALHGAAPLQDGMLYALLLAAGLGAGLLGLVWFEQRFVKSQAAKRKGAAASFSEEQAKRIALMIAIGIGLHNFSEGLAIGQSYASGSISLALLLVIGFGLHNATEGFGIAAPLSGFRPSWRFLALLGLVGGGPTFLGTVVGSVWVSDAVSVLFLSLAAGAIIYVVKELLFHGRTHGEGIKVMSFLVLGFLLGFATDLLIKYASGA
jgi:ZIP family zinc transporter